MQTEERVKALNYCARAIEQLESGIHTVRKDMPGILHAHYAVVRLLRESVKFILPNCAERVDMGPVTLSREATLVSEVASSSAGTRTPNHLELGRPGM